MCLIYLRGRQKGERETEISHELIHYPNAYHSWEWARWKPGARNSVWASHKGGAGSLPEGTAAGSWIGTRAGTRTQALQFGKWETTIRPKAQPQRGTLWGAQLTPQLGAGSEATCSARPRILFSPPNLRTTPGCRGLDGPRGHVYLNQGTHSTHGYPVKDQKFEFQLLQRRSRS